MKKDWSNEEISIVLKHLKNDYRAQKRKSRRIYPPAFALLRFCAAVL
jgi:hypothetical protein